MKVKAFNDEVRSYLVSSGRKQTWLRVKMIEYGVTLAQSSLSERMTGFLPFLDNEISVIKRIMRTYKK
jgi:hypothetical protein